MIKNDSHVFMFVLGITLAILIVYAMIADSDRPIRITQRSTHQTQEESSNGGMSGGQSGQK